MCCQSKTILASAIKHFNHFWGFINISAVQSTVQHYSQMAAPRLEHYLSKMTRSVQMTRKIDESPDAASCQKYN